jgi:hypothetical protein
MPVRLTKGGPKGSHCFLIRPPRFDNSLTEIDKLAFVNMDLKRANCRVVGR